MSVADFYLSMAGYVFSFYAVAFADSAGGREKGIRNRFVEALAMRPSGLICFTLRWRGKRSAFWSRRMPFCKRNLQSLVVRWAFRPQPPCCPPYSLSLYALARHLPQRPPHHIRPRKPVQPPQSWSCQSATDCYGSYALPALPEQGMGDPF